MDNSLGDPLGYLSFGYPVDNLWITLRVSVGLLWVLLWLSFGSPLALLWLSFGWPFLRTP